MEYFVIMNRTVGGYVGSQMSDTDGYTSLASAERFSSKAAAEARLSLSEIVVRVTTGDLGTRTMEVPTCKLELV